MGDGEFMVEQFMFPGHRPRVALVAELPGPVDVFGVVRIRRRDEFGAVGPPVDERLDVVVHVDGDGAEHDPLHAGTVLSVAVSVAEEILLEPLHERIKFLRVDPSLRRRLRELTGTPYHVWSDRPVEFVEDVLHETTWLGQRTILQSCWEHERTAVVASHGTGKTHIAARVVAWWICTRPWGAANAISTAPTWRQVATLLWPHIRRLRASHNLPGAIGLAPQWKINDEVIAYGFSPRDTDEAAGQGIHAPFVLVVIDEAGGIGRPRFQALEGVMSAGIARMLAIGNAPTDDENSAFEERYYLPSWNGIQVPAFRTPAYTDEETPPCTCMVSKFRPHRVVEHLTSPAWVEDVRRDFGEDSAYWVARVLAQFPHGVTSRVIPVAWIEAAQEREVPVEVGLQCALGVDIAAGGGDELAIAVARGFDVSFLEGRSGESNANPLDVARRIKDHILGDDVGWEGLIAAQRLLDPSRRAVVKIDAIGVGWGVTGTLQAWASEFMWPVEVVAVNVAEAPNTEEAKGKFANKRAEMWWSAREQIRDNVRLRIDKRTLAQLSAPKYGTTSSGKTQIEAKKDLKARGLPSPDRAEAVLLAMYQEAWAAPAATSPPGQLTGFRVPGVRGPSRQQPGRPGWG